MYFTYRGKSSDEFGIKIVRMNNLSSPQRSVEKYHIPGRNGALIIDNGYFENFLLQIECDIDSKRGDIELVASKIKEWLQSVLSYDELYLSNKDKYYEAIFVNKLDITEEFKNFGSCILIFDCKPLRKGINDNVLNITTPTILNNPTYLNSLPYVKIYGSGNVTLAINNRNLVIKNLEEFIEIDSEMMNCYKTIDGVIKNENNKMYSPFPFFEPGVNNISWTGNITKIEVLCRWVVL